MPLMILSKGWRCSILLCFSSTKYELEKKLNAMYGCELWDFSSKYTVHFYVAWLKGVRLLWPLPCRTHCNWFPIICDDLPVDFQMHIVFLESIKFNMNSDNGIVNLCARLYLEGSISDTRKSSTYICSKYWLRNKYVHGLHARTIKERRVDCNSYFTG